VEYRTTWLFSKEDGESIKMPGYSLDKHLNDIEMPSFDVNKIEEFDDDEEFDNHIDYDKTKVECICPKCDKKHIMNFRWIGRGTPRKFCPSCKE
jgi:hypothetical protein